MNTFKAYLGNFLSPATLLLLPTKRCLVDACEFRIAGLMPRDLPFRIMPPSMPTARCIARDGAELSDCH